MIQLRVRRVCACVLLAALLSASIAPRAGAQGIRIHPRPAGESREQWYRDGRAAVEAARRLRAQTGRARNVILFVGDGMGIATVTAARILESQLRRRQSGEENLLSFERFPYVALSKTYSVNQQTSDSAPTMTAIITGVKTKDFFVSVDQDAVKDDHTTVAGNELPSFLAHAEQAGLSTGIISTAHVTHATPAACYAHSPNRLWECDKDMPAAARAAGFPDIARQLVEFKHGDGPEVVLGGGRAKFLPNTVADPEDAGEKGERLDGRNLVEEWTRLRPGRRTSYVWNRSQFDAVNPRTTERLLGLFNRSHMAYEHDRSRDKGGEPSLAEMTAKGIDMLAKNPRGYFLMVEGGRVDHAHHDGNAYRALTDAVALSDAVRTAFEKTDPRETLIIVTADHSHVFSIAGYPTRGNDLTGKVVANDARGEPAREFLLDQQKLPYTTLGYANGPGYKRPDGKRPDLTNVDTSHPDYKQEAILPLAFETHGGEDVGIYATGPGAHLIHGVMEQNVIFHVMMEASGLSRTVRGGAAGRQPAPRRARARARR